MIENFKIDSNEIDKIKHINKDDKNFRIENLNAFNSLVFQVKKMKIGSFQILEQYFQKTLKS